MKTIAALLAALVAALAVAGSAAAAPSPSQLQRQINQLKGKVSALQGRVGALEQRLADAEEGLVVVTNYAICGDALISDVLRVILISLGFGDPGRVDDEGACAYFGITRPPRAALAAGLAGGAVARAFDAQRQLAAAAWRR